MQIRTERSSLPWRAAAAVLALLLARPLHAADDAQLAQGRYLTRIAGCASCHTAVGGQPFAGGQMIDTPFGALSTPNITPDKQTGIGNWSDEDFYRAMHSGIGKDGQYLYPVMPFPWYTRATRADVQAIKAYLFSTPAVHAVRAPSSLRFPFSVRSALGVWREAFFTAGEFVPDPLQSAALNRGAYLVTGLAHCGECHDARPVAGQSKYAGVFQGGVVDQWYAPNITSDAVTGIGAWTERDLVDFLSTGMNHRSDIAIGPMSETVGNLARATPDDLQAMALYLKSVPAARGPHAKVSSESGRQARGSGTYQSYCAWCHGLHGDGVAGMFPSLQGNAAVTARGGENVVRAILGGLEARGTYAPMIAIGAGMSDQEVSDVANYVRQAGGNAAPADMQVGTVHALRMATRTLMNGSPGGACPAIADPALARALATPDIAQLLTGLKDAAVIDRADRIVQLVRAGAPGVAPAALVNGVTARYCQVLHQDAALGPDALALQLGQFSEIVYGATRARPAEGAGGIAR